MKATSDRATKGSRTARPVPLERLALAVVAVVRIAGVLSIGKTAWGRHPLVDAYTYWDQARALLAGRDPFQEGFYQPPGYPVFLWAVAKLMGAEAPPDLSIPGVRLVQVALGLATAWVLIGLGRRIGSAVGAPWVGAVAGLLYGLYPTTALFELDLLTPAVTCAAFAGALALAWPSPKGRVCRFRTALAGLLVGFASVVHATYLLVGAAMLGWMRVRDRDSSRRGQVGGRMLAFAAGLALALAPTTLINWTRWHQVALVSHNAGINFFIGNNTDWRDTSFLEPGLPFRKLALEADPAHRDLFARDRYWWHRAWADIERHPLAWVATLGTKAFWSINNGEIPRNTDYRCETRDGAMAWYRWLPVRWGWVFPLAVLGAAGAWRRGQPRAGGPPPVELAAARFLPVAWLALQAPMVFFLVADRYRVATWPVVSLLGALGFCELGELTNRFRTGGRPIGPLVLGVVAAVVPWLPMDSRTGFDPGRCAHMRANLAWMDGDHRQAEQLYEAAVKLDPGDIGAWSFLAHARHRRGDTFGAIRAMQHVLDVFPDSYPSLRSMARFQEEAGNLDAAIEAARRAYAVPGPHTAAGLKLLDLLVKAGRRDEAWALVRTHSDLRHNKKAHRILTGK